jgi:hypothetical protein
MDRQRRRHVRGIPGAKSGGVKHRDIAVLGLRNVAEIHAHNERRLRRRIKLLSLALIALAVLIWR